MKLPWKIIQSQFDSERYISYNLNNAKTMTWSFATKLFIKWTDLYTRSSNEFIILPINNVKQKSFFPIFGNSRGSIGSATSAVRKCSTPPSTQSISTIGSARCPSCFSEARKNRSRDRRKQASPAREPEIVKPNSQTSVGLGARRCHLTTPTRPPRLD